MTHVSDLQPPPQILARARVTCSGQGGWSVVYIDRNGRRAWHSKANAFASWWEAYQAAIMAVSLQQHLDSYSPKQKPMKRKTVAADRKSAVMERDGAACRACGSTDDLTIDHYLPISRGGSNDLNNLLLLCLRCNEEKANDLPLTYRLQIVGGAA